MSNTQIPSSNVMTSLCGYSSVSEAWKVCVYVNGGASFIGDVYESLTFWHLLNEYQLSIMFINE